MSAKDDLNSPIIPETRLTDFIAAISTMSVGQEIMIDHYGESTDELATYFKTAANEGTLGGNRAYQVDNCGDSIRITRTA